MMKRGEKVWWENRTVYQVTSQMARCDLKVSRDTKRHIMYNILISGKLVLSTVWSQRCCIIQHILYITTSSL